MNGEMRGKMAVITIKIQNKDGMTLSVARGEDEAALVYTKEYEEGDEIITRADKNCPPHGAACSPSAPGILQTDSGKTASRTRYQAA